MPYAPVGEHARLEIGGPIYKAGGKIKDQFGNEKFLTASELRAMVPQVLQVKTVMFKHNNHFGHVGEIIRAHVDNTDTLHIDALLFPAITCGIASRLRAGIMSGELGDWSFGWNEEPDGTKLFVEASVVPEGHFKVGKITRVRGAADSIAQTVIFMPLAKFEVKGPLPFQLIDSIKTNSILGSQLRASKPLMETNNQSGGDASAASNASLVIPAANAATALSSTALGNAGAAELPTELMQELARYRAEKALEQRRVYEDVRARVLASGMINQYTEFIGARVLPQAVASTLRAHAGGSSAALSKTVANASSNAAAAAGFTAAHEERIESEVKTFVGSMCELMQQQAPRELLDYAEDRTREVSLLRAQLVAQQKQGQAGAHAHNISREVDAMATTWADRQIQAREPDPPGLNYTRAKRPSDDTPADPTQQNPSMLRAAKRPRPTTGPAQPSDFIANVQAAFEDLNNYHPPGAPIPQDQRGFAWVQDSKKQQTMPIFTRPGVTL